MINKALRLLRSFHGLKQKDAAQMLGISASHLSEIEKGTKSVSFDLLQRYSDVFEIPVSSITMFAEISEASGENKSAKLKALISDKALRLLDWLDTVSSVHEKAHSSKP